MKRYFALGAVLLAVLFCAQTVLSDSGTPSTMKRQTWTAKQRFKCPAEFKERVGFENGSDVNMESGSDTEFESGSKVTFTTAPTYTVTPMTWVYETGFTVTTSLNTGAIYTFSVTGVTTTSIDMCGAGEVWDYGTAGVTIALPTPTAALDGKIFGILKTDSGTTDGVLYCSGLPINSTSATTNESLEMDAVGDIIWLMPQYNSAVSYFIVNHYVH